MEKANITQKIQAVTALFKNIRDTHSREEINDIRTKIYKNTKLYEHYANKTKINNKETKSLNKAINNFKKLHEYLLNKEASIDNNTPYELDKLFEHHKYYKPIVSRSSFEGNYVKYTSSGDFTSSIGIFSIETTTYKVICHKDFFL